MARKASALPIHLEGTTLEGGGQLLRLALGLSSLTKKPINITNIRGNRSRGGGLKAQHLTSVQWLGQACNARLSGIGLKSKEITFIPNQEKGANRVPQLDHRGGDISITQNTPGSINLVLQAILPFLLFSGASSPMRVRITGGTNVSNSPSFDYVLEVLLPMLALIGIQQIGAQLHSRSWSQGSTTIGGITYTVTPLTKQLPAFQLTDRGIITHVKVIVIAPKETEQQFRDELHAMFDKREHRIFGTNNLDPDISISFENSHHEKRYYLLLVATSTTGIKLGRDWLYDKAIRPGKTEKVVPTMVKQVSDELIKEIEHGGCVDEYLRDQLVVFQALAEGKSQVCGGRRTNKGGEDVLVEPSLHAQTAMWVAKEIVGVEFDEESGCEGIGFVPGGSVAEQEAAEGLTEDIAKIGIST
jgi:RNA 3'-terminal phosphate cyclase (ATP)